MADPKIAQPFAYMTDVEEGKTYKWCACGLSSTQPFCDNSHIGTDFEPIEYTATATKKIRFCGCKHSKIGAICDNTHNHL